MTFKTDFIILISYNLQIIHVISCWSIDMGHWYDTNMLHIIPLTLGSVAILVPLTTTAWWLSIEPKSKESDVSALSQRFLTECLNYSFWWHSEMSNYYRQASGCTIYAHNLTKMLLDTLRNGLQRVQ